MIFTIIGLYHLIKYRARCLRGKHSPPHEDGRCHYCNKLINKWKPITFEDLTPEVQKKVDEIERLIKESGGEIVERRIESDEDEK